jgi:hypothetical protein
LPLLFLNRWKLNFEKEINTVLLKENAMALANKKEVATYFKSDLDKNKADITSLKSEITKRKEVNTLYETYITEAEGTTGTKN